MGQRLGDGQYRVLLPGGQAWPARTDRGLSPQLLARGSVNLPMPRTWLREDGRIAITSVAPVSAAAKAGLQPGSDILAIEGESPARYLDRIAPASLRAGADARRADLLALDLGTPATLRSEEHTSELQSQSNLVCRLLLEKKKNSLARDGKAPTAAM